MKTAVGRGSNMTSPQARMVQQNITRATFIPTTHGGCNYVLVFHTVANVPNDRQF